MMPLLPIPQISTSPINFLACLCSATWDFCGPRLPATQEEQLKLLRLNMNSNSSRLRCNSHIPWVSTREHPLQSAVGHVPYDNIPAHPGRRRPSVLRPIREPESPSYKDHRRWNPYLLFSATTPQPSTTQPVMCAKAAPVIGYPPR